MIEAIRRSDAAKPIWRPCSGIPSSTSPDPDTIDDAALLDDFLAAAAP